MQLRRGVSAVSAVLFLAALLLSSITDAFNVTIMLDKHPEFSTFNHYLSVTQLAPEINRRRTITVCAVDNSGMADLLAKHLTLGGIKNVLLYHVLLDYFDAKKLHQITDGNALAATMYQATGSATGSSGFINITDLSRGKVGFSPKDNGGSISATFVKSVEAQPYDISIIQISNLLPSAEAEAPAPSLVNITRLMSAHGCKVFADTLSGNPAETTFEDNINSGLTIFCPGDEAMKAFLPKYKNLTAADQQSLLEYQGMPIYESLTGLRSSNGLTSTLATVGDKFFFTVQNDGTDVTIKTKLVTATIVNTLADNPPLAIFEVNKVLIPSELSKLSGLAPAPAPAPGPAADSPKSSKIKHKSPPAPPVPSDSPADAPDGDVADQTSNGADMVGISGGILAALVLTGWSTFLQL